MITEIQAPVAYITAEPVVVESAEERQRFVSGVCEKIRQALKDREPRVEQWKMNWAQYRGQLKIGDAGPRESKLDFTQSRELARQYIAQILNPINSQRELWSCEPLDPRTAAMARELERLENHIGRNEVYGPVMEPALEQKVVTGAWWAKYVWTAEIRNVRIRDAGLAVTGEQEVVDFIGCKPQLIETSRMVFPASPGGDVQRAPWIAEEYFERPSEIRAKIAAGQYRADVDWKAIGDESKKPDPKLTASSTPKDDDGTCADDSPKALYEWYGPGPDGNETIMWVDIASERDLAWVVNFYDEWQRPYVYSAFFKVLSSLDHESLMDALANLHKAYTAILNCMLNAGSQQKLIFYLEELGLEYFFKKGKIPNGGAMKAKDPATAQKLRDSIVDIDPSLHPPAELMTVLQVVREHMHNLSSIAAAMFGREVASRPTAHGTDRVLNESQQPLSLMLKNELDSWAEGMKMQLARYRQFAPSGLDYWVQARTPEGQQLLLESFRWPREYWAQSIAVKTKVSAHALNREVRRQELMALLREIGQFVNQLMPLVDQATAQTPSSQIAAQLALIELKVFDDLLEEHGVIVDGEIDVAAVEGIANGQWYGQIVNQMVEQIHSLEQQLGAIAGGPGGPGGPGVGPAAAGGGQPAPGPGPGPVGRAA